MLLLRVGVCCVKRCGCEDADSAIMEETKSRERSTDTGTDACTYRVNRARRQTDRRGKGESVIKKSTESEAEKKWWSKRETESGRRGRSNNRSSQVEMKIDETSTEVQGDKAR